MPSDALVEKGLDDEVLSKSRRLFFWLFSLKSPPSPHTQRVCFLFCFWRSTMMDIELDHAVRGGEPYLRTRGMITSRSVNMARHPRGSYIVMPIAVSGVATPENKV